MKNMGIQGIQPLKTSVIQPSFTLPSAGALDGAQQESGKAFSSILGNALGNVNEAMNASSKATKSLATGDLNGLHEMTIAGAKSEVMMKLTTTITSKLAQSVTQLFQMQM